MVPVLQPADASFVGLRLPRILRTLLAVLSALASASLASAQNAPTNTVGRIEGLDVTVDGGASAGIGALTGAPSIFVVNGGVVTVHSGQAQLTFLFGGKVDVCGPAKFAVLQSGAAITLALNFGKLRIQLPGATSLRIFTPTIIATPLDINGAARDITVGLELNDSLCVRAATGALQLEHQFTGEKLIVPQEGEFYLAEGKLLPVAQTPGSCECAALQARVAQPVPRVPEVGLTSPPITVEAPPATSAAAAKALRASEPPPVELSVATHEDSAKKPAESSKKEAPPPPAVTMPEYTAIAPPLVFSANSPAPPPGAGSDTILLVRVAHIFPDWEFSGHVDSPPLASGSVATGLAQPPSQSAQSSGKHKNGFWSAVKKFFGGKS